MMFARKHGQTIMEVALNDHRLANALSYVSILEVQRAYDVPENTKKIITTLKSQFL